MRFRSTFQLVMPALVSCTLAATPVWADSYRLRADTFAAAEPGIGLVVLQAESPTRSWLDAEALVWAGAGDNESDALVVMVRLRDPENRGQARLGRMLIATGAIRPVHIDGLSVAAKAPWGIRLEAFGGAPVVPHFGERDSDWLLGTRVSHQDDHIGTAGVSFLYRRDAGSLSDKELGLDLASAPLNWLSVAARGSWDLLSPGISEARVSATARRKKLSGVLFGARRSPSRLLPATSLFSALGDFASDELGVSSRWRAAPRLDLYASATARTVGDDLGADLLAHALLRLDDRGTNSVSIELHRQDSTTGAWTGVRGTGRLAVANDWTTVTELELVIPDESDGRGTLWPWGLAALRWQPSKAWQAAVAVEAGASLANKFELDVLFRLSRQWQVQP